MGEIMEGKVERRTAKGPGKNIIAITGKGGTGKTVLTALMIKCLISSANRRLLVIDADPLMGLASALDLKPNTVVEDIRKKIIRSARSDEENEPVEIARNLDYMIFEALIERAGYAVLAMGQPEGAGCFCPVNSLLRQGIEALAKGFDIILIDCEAGLEQISRSVLGNVDTVLVVTDPSVRGAESARSIEVAARKFTSAKNIGLIINRVRDQSEDILPGQKTGMKIVGWIPEDEQISKSDLIGKPIVNISNQTQCVQAVQEIIRNLDLA